MIHCQQGVSRSVHKPKSVIQQLSVPTCRCACLLKVYGNVLHDEILQDIGVHISLFVDIVAAVSGLNARVFFLAVPQAHVMLGSVWLRLATQ